jgi:hypothetical protein
MTNTAFARQAAVVEFREAPSRKRQTRPIEVCEDSRPVFVEGVYVGHRPVHANATQRYLASVAEGEVRAAHEAAQERLRALHGRKAIRRQRAA